MEKSSFLDGLLRVLTLGLYGRGSTRKKVKKYRKDGQLRIDKEVERQGVGMISNDSDIINGSNINEN